MADRSELDTRVPFSRAAGMAAGLKPSTLRGPGFRRPFTGVFVAADAPTSPAQRVRAALVPFGGRAFASHASAARVYGVPLPTIPEEHVTVVDRKHRRNRPGIACHLVAAARTTRIAGIDVSVPGQLFVELASLLSLVDLVVAGDHLVRHRGVTPEELLAAARSSRLPNARFALRAAGYVRRRVKSPMETRLRMLLVLAGLPEPEVNVLVGSEGGPKREHDLVYRAARLGLEYDGRQHADDPVQWRTDIQRREDSDDDGWRILVVLSDGVYVDPEATVRKVWRLLRERGAPDVPRVLSEEWRAHFPGRG